MATEVVATRRRIIRRPRLTTMLDESSARVRLLVAPAGYGKTTLAREWLGEPERRDVWYRGGPASADVAAVAVGISEAVGAIVPDAGKRMRERLRATGHPEEDVDILAELFAEDVQMWPGKAWLAFDDYQFAMESAASERFVDLLTQTTPIQILITSRTRPTWTTARRILYGEIQEIDRRALAMDKAEARQLVGQDEQDLGAFLERARGWPAVIGLVGLTASRPDVTEAVPGTLYDYFAQELYDSLPRAHRQGLGELSFASRFDRRLAEQIVGKKAQRILESGLRAGAINRSEWDSFDFHPLFADFLRERVFDSFASRQDVASKVGNLLLASKRWDDAVAMACEFGLPDLLVATIESSLYVLLDSGRLATVARWLEAGATLHPNSPVLDLAEAELAFRTGEYRRAERMAERAARKLGDEHPLASRAYANAGQSALLASREEASIAYFRSAKKTASSTRDTREALVGLYSAMSELEIREAAEVLAELDQLKLESADDDLRVAVAKVMNAVRSGGIEDALESAVLMSQARERASNPLVETSYLHVLSQASSAVARYKQAVMLAMELLAVGKEHRLDFVRPFGIVDRAIGHLGLRSFADANHDMRIAETLAPDDVHIHGNLAALRCRLLLATGRVSQAADATQLGVFREKPSAPLHAEILAFRALALVCAGLMREGLAVLDHAEAVSETALVVQVLGPAIRSISSNSQRSREEHARTMWAKASTTGNFDTLVSAYRAYPDLLTTLSQQADDQLSTILAEANDAELAQRHGITIPPPHRIDRDSLTPREVEVMDLVAVGLSNREVAKSLFITESTVKVHLRHAYEKLGVRGRAEAVPKWLTPR
jgi:LuxR family transcriptional regulator, maltose regulon positive regulatory protein